MEEAGDKEIMGSPISRDGGGGAGVLLRDPLARGVLPISKILRYFSQKCAIFHYPFSKLHCTGILSFIATNWTKTGKYACLNSLIS